jgi:hypothetical protein
MSEQLGYLFAVLALEEEFVFHGLQGAAPQDDAHGACEHPAREHEERAHRPVAEVGLGLAGPLAPPESLHGGDPQLRIPAAACGCARLRSRHGPMLIHTRKPGRAQRTQPCNTDSSLSQPNLSGKVRLRLRECMIAWLSKASRAIDFGATFP